MRSRALLAVAVLIAVIFAWIAIRGQFGNMLAEFTLANDPNAPIVADLARSLAPSDPLTMWLRASVEKNIFTPQRSNTAVEMFKDTVRLAPNDYRWWVELGRALEQAGSPAEAEMALKQAVALAPAYTFPRWQLGNFYLRQARTDEAFVELKKATENNHTYREQVFSLAWDYFEKDTAKLEQVIADKPDVYASLALFYGARGQAADSLRIWNTLTDEEKAGYPQFLGVISQGLYEKRYFPQALAFTKQLGMDTDAEPNAITNGDFEKGISDEKETRFGWKIFRTDSKLDASTDTAVHHSGARSLKVVFRNYNKPDLFNVWQTVVVEPGRTYRLRFWMRTENLRSGGMPQLQVVNANDDKIITTSAPFPAGTNEWTEFSLDITSPDNCNGLIIRTVRGFCGDNCPIVGTIWYDDFELLKL